MCSQVKVLKKLRKQGKLSNEFIELAEAQADDYILQRKESEAGFKELKDRFVKVDERIDELAENQAEIKGIVQSISDRLNSGVDQDRLDGVMWREVRAFLKSKKAWIIYGVLFLLFVFAGKGLSELVPSVLDKIL